MLHDDESAGETAVDDRAEVVGGLFGDAAEAAESGGVHHDVDSPGALEQRGDTGFVGDIHPGGVMRCAEFGGPLLGAVGIAVGDGDLPAAGGQAFSHRPADSRCATDDNGPLRCNF